MRESVVLPSFASAPRTNAEHSSRNLRVFAEATDGVNSLRHLSQKLTNGLLMWAPLRFSTAEIFLTRL